MTVGRLAEITCSTMPAPDAWSDFWYACEVFAASLDVSQHHTHCHNASEMSAWYSCSRFESQPDPDPVFELKSLAVCQSSPTAISTALVGTAYSITGARSCEGSRCQESDQWSLSAAACRESMAGYFRATMPRLRPTNSILRNHAKSSQRRGKGYKAVSWHPDIIRDAPINTASSLKTDRHQNQTFDLWSVSLLVSVLDLKSGL